MFKTFRTFSLLTLAGAVLFSSATLAATELPIDTAKSVVNWTGTKVTGNHTGTLGIKSGSVLVEDGKPTGGTFVFDMNSIHNTDLTDPAYKTKLENHLKSDDFFNVAEFGTATFEIKSLTPIAGKESEYSVVGNLIIKGISKEIAFNSTIKETDDSYLASADLKFDRTLWNVKYNSGKFFDLANLGDKLIYDEIDIHFSVIAPK